MPENIASYVFQRKTAADLDRRSSGRAMTSQVLDISSPVGLIAAGGAMPFAVADSMAARGIDSVVFALKGSCDPIAVARFRHHWISVGQFGRAEKLFRSENC